MTSLNLGCGLDILPGWVNLDVVPLPGVDVVHDLDAGPWPFADGSIGAVRAHDVFEHVGNPVLFMTECHRVLEPGGDLVIRTPLAGTLEAHTDPTHKRAVTPYSFDFWIPGTKLFASNLLYGGVSFRKSDGRQEGGNLIIWLVKI